MIPLKAYSFKGLGEGKVCHKWDEKDKKNARCGFYGWENLTQFEMNAIV